MIILIISLYLYLLTYFMHVAIYEFIDVVWIYAVDLINHIFFSI